MAAAFQDLFARMFLALIGLGWFVHNAKKLGKWLTNGRAKAPALYWIMVPYRTGCMIFGALWMTYMLVARIPPAAPKSPAMQQGR